MFARAASIEEPSALTFIGLSLLSVLLAYLTWRFIETPARARSGPKAISRTQIFGFSATGIVVLLAIGFAGHTTNGAPSRFDPKLVRVNAFESFEAFNCAHRGRFYDCRIGDNGAESSFVLLGDSHANRYAIYLQKELNGTGLVGEVGINGLCPPLLGFGPTAADKHAASCRLEMQKKIHGVAESTSIKSVVLASEWAVYPTGTRDDEVFPPYRALNQAGEKDVEQGLAFQKAVKETVDFFHAAGKRVIIVAPVPEYGFTVTQRLQKYLRSGRDLDPLDLPLSVYNERNRDFVRAVSSLKGKIILVDPIPLLCRQPDGACRPYNEGYLPLTADSNHLSPVGTSLVGPLLIRALQQD